MRKSLPLGVAALLAAAPLFAQTSSPPALELRAAANGVRDAAHARSLALRRYDLAVTIRGAVAAVTLDAAFANPSSETLEGDLRLRLPTGAIVTGYALDVGGQMVDGVLVDRPRAKAIYDARVRRGVDPGLGEVSADNVFETHIHPIWPNGGRKLRIRYVVPLSAEALHMPLAMAASGEGWSIAVRAPAGAAPTVLAPDGSRLALHPEGDGEAGRLSGTKALAGDLVIARGPQPALLVSQHSSGERDLQLGGNLVTPAKAAPTGSLRIYWDRSRARLDGDVTGDIAVVGKLIALAHPAVIELVAFNSSGAQRQRVTSAQAATDWLGQLRYRGATSFAAIAGDAAVDRCVLFAEGGPDIDRAVAFAPRCRLDEVSASPRADRAWLHHIAIGHGGGDYALAGNPEAVAAALAVPSAGVVAVLDQDGEALPFVPLNAGAGRWLVLARAPEGGPVTIRLADASGTHDLLRALDGPGAAFDGAGALIAADQLATLGATERRDDYVALSRRYGIASASLSFLVLESPQDYLAAKVEPPASYPADERDAWLRARKAQDAGRDDARLQWQDHVATEWAEQVTWWHTRFDPHARPQRIATSPSFDRTRANDAGAPPPPPPPVMAPPPPVMAVPSPIVQAAPAPRDENIVVTAQRRNPGAARDEAADDVAAPDSDDADGAPGTTIHIDPWQPDRPYLELYDGKPEDFDARFLEAEKRHGTLPIFYLDTAEWLRKRGDIAGAREMVLSALALPTANEVTLGMVADRLERYGELDRAIELRERQAALDPDRPQPRRLLALALARRAVLDPARARTDLTRAVDLLYAIAMTPQDGRWAGIEMIALNEANALLPRLRQAGGSVAMDPRLVALLDCDMRVVIDWTSDGTDMDLWIDEPDGERAIYNNPRTAIGGHLSHDMTQGYGPEEYLLHAAPPGAYAVQANVYAPDRLDPNGATLITAHLFHDFGRKNQREESVDIEVKRDDQGAKPIGQMVIAP